MSEKKPLIPKRQRFCDEIVIDNNAKQAAIRAGYSPKTAEQQGSRLLRDDKVQKEIARLRSEKSEELGLTHKYVLEGLMEVKERCMQGKPIMVKGDDGKFIEGPEWRFDSKGANRALELLGKNLGIFKDNLSVNHTGEITVEAGKSAREFIEGKFVSEDADS